MKLRNKKPVEKPVVIEKLVETELDKEVNETLKPLEEPKEYWYIDDAGVIQISNVLDSMINMRKSIGNYFSLREEAEKVVEKLTAWKRLKDKGFKVDLWDYDGGNYQERIKTGRILFIVKDYEENDKDLDLLFCPEENS